MRVLLVDDHALFLEGMTNLLRANDIEVLGTAANGEEALRKTAQLQPNVILMDVQMPAGGGIEATRLIKNQFPQVKIVMLTVSQDDTHLFEAIKAGAAGYLLKGLPKEAFLAQLSGLANGEAPLSPGLAAKVLSEFSRREQERGATESSAVKTSPLSQKQMEILKLVAGGLTYKEVSNQVDLSEATIKYHMGEIIARLHLENRSQVIAYALKMGLV
ncbi:MAG TPA: response regulator transcription factor [Patescibacteria group bacterium]|nr:response regulator transcription factor [Patescibacteria group bacterium]